MLELNLLCFAKRYKGIKGQMRCATYYLQSEIKHLYMFSQFPAPTADNVCLPQAKVFFWKFNIDKNITTL